MPPPPNLEPDNDICMLNVPVHTMRQTIFMGKLQFLYTAVSAVNFIGCILHVIKYEILTLQKELLHLVQRPFFWPRRHMDSSLHRQKRQIRTEGPKKHASIPDITRHLPWR